MLSFEEFTLRRDLRCSERNLGERAESDVENIQIARTQIANARRLFILGYGFDENNNQRLNLSEAIRQHKKRVCFTDNNRNINKRASKIMFGDENHFRSESDWFEAGLHERSARNVYDALAHDFDL